MSEEFASSYSTTISPADMLSSVERPETHPGRFRLGLVAAGLAIASTMGGALNAAPAEASIGNEKVYDPSASFAEKVQSVEIAGHRGLKGYYDGRKADEDTTRSCLHAVAAGADACEIDMRVTKDHVPIVMHDDTTNRVTRDCNLKIATHTYRRLKRCHMNHGDRISSLNGLAKAMSPYRNRVDIIAEIKDQYITNSELRTINTTFAHYGFGASNLAYESFYGRNLRRMEAIAPQVKSLLIKGDITSPMRAADLPSAFDGIIIPYEAFVNGEQVDRNFSEEYRQRGKDIIPWGVQTLDQMRYVIQNGASGLMSDHVGRARSLD